MTNDEELKQLQDQIYKSMCDRDDPDVQKNIDSLEMISARIMDRRVDDRMAPIEKGLTNSISLLEQLLAEF